MKCVSCGFELPDNSKFCTECGASQPQIKICPRCKTELPLAAKFCFNCGYSLKNVSSASSSGINMGDKNVVAGDIIGHKDEYKVSGNATIIKNEDETKKVVRCHVCSKNLRIVNTHTCPVCGGVVCDNCFDNVSGMCVSCKDNNKTSGENEYKEALKKVYKDGKLDLDKRKYLQTLQNKLGLSEKKCKQLENEIKFRYKNNSFTTIEEINLEDAEKLYFDKHNTSKAYELLKPVYDKHKYNENVLELYIPILAEIDSNKAINLINNLKTDMLIAFLVKINIYLDKNLSEAENLINKAEQLWNGNYLIKCSRGLLFFKLYEKTNRELFYNDFYNILKSLAKPSTKYEVIWKKKCTDLIDVIETIKRKNDKIEKKKLFAARQFELFEKSNKKPVLLPEGTDGTFGPGGTYVYFGLWPQSVKYNSVYIDESDVYEINDWYCYKGSDNNYYIKEVSDKRPDIQKFNNGKQILGSQDYYFKLEPIKWRVLTEQYLSRKLLLCENVLTRCCFYNNHFEERGTFFHKIYPSNYEFSDIRNWLNNYFIERAFSKEAINKIDTVIVDNGNSSALQMINKYACNDTRDKIFLLSKKEVASSKYGLNKDIARVRTLTDYSMVTGGYNRGWWLRTNEGSSGARIVTVTGRINGDSESIVSFKEVGVVPALSISF